MFSPNTIIKNIYNSLIKIPKRYNLTLSFLLIISETKKAPIVATIHPIML